MTYILNLCLKDYDLMWPYAADMHNKKVVSSWKGLLPGDF